MSLSFSREMSLTAILCFLVFNSFVASESCPTESVETEICFIADSPKTETLKEFFARIMEIRKKCETYLSATYPNGPEKTKRLQLFEEQSDSMLKKKSRDGVWDKLTDGDFWKTAWPMLPSLEELFDFYEKQKSNPV